MQVEVVNFNSDKFSQSEYDVLCDERVKDPDMTEIQPKILPEESENTSYTGSASSGEAPYPRQIMKQKN